MEASLSSAVSGINAEQTWLDTISNNLANADTDGFSESNIEFSDMLTQAVSGASAPVPPARGGVNPVDVGSGVEVSSITPDFTQASVSSTGIASNAAIEGNGFFVVNDGGQQLYTQDGAFNLDANGNLVTGNGGLVQGWMASNNGVITPNGPTSALTIPTGQQVPATATSQVVLGGNLSAGATTAQEATVTAYDAQGNAVPITLTFTPSTTTPGDWTMQGSTTDPATGATSNLWSSPQTLTFDATGQIATVNGTAVSATTPTSVAVTTLPAGYQWPAGAKLSFVIPTPGSAAGLTQDAGSGSAGATSQNGSAAGTLESYSIGADGVITGSFSNGGTRAIGQLALANFPNETGLADQGTNYYAMSANSGAPQIGAPGTGPLGTLVGGSVDQSNVNMAGQMTAMVEAQTNYEADTKVVTTTATVLQSLVQMA